MLADNCKLVRTEWGWTRLNDSLTPIPTDRNVAPGNILKVIRCKGKGTSKTNVAPTFAPLEKWVRMQCPLVANAMESPAIM